MEEKRRELRLNAWIDLLLARGVFSFSIELAKSELPNYTEIALRRALSRLSAKGKILSVYKGYYLILPPQYSIKGILPPTLFLDAFFRYLNRPYYLSLISAAAYHGAAHQKPQEYFVMTSFPAMRPTQKKGLKINYISIDKIPENLIEKRKTEAGYLNISTPLLTAADLVHFEKRIGGLNRAATIMNELVEVISKADFSAEFLSFTPATVLQRLGYLLEFICHNTILSEALFSAIVEQNIQLYRIPLKSYGQTEGFSSDNRWKVIVNLEIDPDL
jgi:predicted transcriptional regulator of viral defense system